MKKYNTVIIGGGPAGYTAALYAARAGLSVIVLEMLSPGGQMATTTEIDNYPGFDETVDGFDLAYKMKTGAERFGAESAMAQVVSLELSPEIKKVHTTDGEYEADTVIIATGAAPRELGLENEGTLRGRGVSYCATCDGMMYKNKTVVVVGGGNTAAEDALYLSKLCKKVYMVHRRDTLRATAAYRKQLEAAENVEFVWNGALTEIYADNVVTGAQITNLVTGEKTDLECNGVFIAIGRIPNTDLVKGQIDLDKEGYIIADETTVTNIPGVFAAGDVRQKPLRQIVTAAADGAVAVKYAEEYIGKLE
ncbi:MAG: thioredoxin-disulfide reductase [Clostridia bacterium]|nr:thioredoxin-disulfide reductase [Clostridia bacterium]